MSFVDDLRRQTADSQSGELERRRTKQRLDGLADGIFSVIKRECERVAPLGKSSVEGYVDRDYDGDLVFVECSASSSVWHGPAEERHRLQRERTKAHSSNNYMPEDLLRRSEWKRVGVFYDLSQQDAQSVEAAVYDKLSSLGLSVKTSLVQFHDIKSISTTGQILGLGMSWIKELPSTYYNLIVSVSW